MFNPGENSSGERKGRRSTLEKTAVGRGKGDVQPWRKQQWGEERETFNPGENSSGERKGRRATLKETAVGRGKGDVQP